jgi:co-chaperonin GroES (HSP10)
MKVLSKFVLVKKHPESRETSGFMYGVGDTRELRYHMADIVDLGDMVKGMKSGDKILFDKVAGHDVLINEDRLTVIQEKDIVCVFP